MSPSKICLALDGLNLLQALTLTRQIGRFCHAVKIHDLYDARGPSIISDLKEAGARRVWVDAKLHDTKDTVGLRAHALIRNRADIVTVHASGGVPMMKEAVTAAYNGCDDQLAEIWAITVLTSLDKNEIAQIHGADRSPGEIVLDRALAAGEAGVHGIVCSAEEVGVLSQHPDLQGRSLAFVVPGTRSVGVELGQQKRSGTPAQAIADGATYLVAGSQVTKAEDPIKAFSAMVAEIS